jgi:hypothetical protein
VGLADGIDLSRVSDPGMRTAIVGLLNLIEDQNRRIQALTAENERLRAEIRRLKGEPPPPTARPQAGRAADLSSERERREPRAWRKQGKNETLRIDRVEVLRVERASLPADAEFKGYAEVVVQELVLRAETIRFRKEIWYAPSTGQTYRAPLPPGYRGQFGPGLKALVLVLAHAGQMSGPKIREVLASAGVAVSAGQMSNLLVKDQDIFQRETVAVYEAGLRSSPWQHYDDTSTRVAGQDQVCHIVGNPLYSAYFTTPRKDRLTVLDVLRNQAPRVYRVNAEALSYLAGLGLSAALRQAIAAWPQDVTLDEAELTRRLEAYRPALGPQQQTRVREALAVAAYQAQTTWPVVRALVTDDAAQFKGLTEDHALCWIHEGRLYKKLQPALDRHAQLLRQVLDRFWGFYRRLGRYRDHPSRTTRWRLARDFDRLFTPTTGYAALDDRIAHTRARRDFLLRVLDHPELPLHNNPAELAARQRVRKRDISFGPRVRDGTAAWDTFQSLVATTHKLGVSFFAYVRDRLAGAAQIPPLAEILTQRAQTLRLGASWGLP